MPVSISLCKFVLGPDTRPLWPDEFAKMIEGLEAQPDDRTTWGVLADWLAEHDEPELETAARWLIKRPEVTVKKSFDNWRRGSWVFDGVPLPVSVGEDPIGDDKTLAGALAKLWVRIQRAREAADWENLP